MVGRRSTIRSLVGAVILALGLGLLAPVGPARAAAPAERVQRPVPGGQTSGDSLFPQQGNTGYDVSHYAITIDATKLPRITATTTISAYAKRALSSFSLDLEGLKVSSVKVNGHRARFARRAAKLVVTPSRAVRKHFTVVVRYSGTPKPHADADGSSEGWLPLSSGVVALNEPIGAMTWFPVNNTLRDKATFSYTIRAKSNRAVAANGELISKKRHGSARTWRWRLRQPIAPYLSVVSIGDYRVFASRYRSIDGRSIKIWSFVERALGALSAQRALLPQVLRFHERNFGPYPFRSAGMIVHRSSIGYALETATRPYFSAKPSTEVIVHEQAHQWFGDTVTPCDWRDIWLNEGFATYATWMWDGAHGGATPAQALAKTYADNPAGSELWSPAPAKFSDPADLFGDPVYTRGAMTLQVLRARVGDGAFAAILKRWAAHPRNRCATTAEFVALAQRVSGKDLRALFNTWLYVAARPASAG